MSHEAFYRHARQVHFALVIMSFFVIIMVFTISGSAIRKARSQLEEIAAVVEHLSAHDLDNWASQRDVPLMVTIRNGTPQGSDVRYQIIREAVLVSISNGLSSFRDDSESVSEGSCIAHNPAFDDVPDTRFRLIASVINPSQLKRDLRIALRAPESLHELKDLWKHLSEPSAAKVLPMDLMTLEHGFIANVTKSDGSPPVVDVEYTHVEVEVEERNDGESLEEKQLCLIQATPSHFVDMNKKANLGMYGLDRFNYAYIHTSTGSDDTGSYRTLIVPVESGSRFDKAEPLEILENACASSGSNRSCDRWKRPLAELFPELEKSDWVPTSLAFGEAVEVMRRMEELTKEGQLNIPGASVPISERTLLVILAAVIVLQCYLLLAIHMVIKMTQAGSGGVAGERVAWIALFDDNLLRLAWHVSLILPPLGILVSILWTPGIGILGVDTSDGGVKIGPQIFCFFVSACLACATLRWWWRGFVVAHRRCERGWRRGHCRTYGCFRRRATRDCLFGNVPCGCTLYLWHLRHLWYGK